MCSSVVLPASVKFDFDICSLKNDLINSVKSFEIGDELDLIVDRYITSRIGGTILDGNSSVIDEVKTFISGQACTVANRIKTNITNLIESISCVRRRLDEMEIDQDGSQRLLSTDKTFAYLVKQILLIEGVDSATAGLDLARMEVGLNVAIRVDKFFSGSYFQSALEDVFYRLAPIQAVFGVATSENPAMGDLLNMLKARSTFQLSFSAGAKVNENVMVFFQKIVSGAAPNLTGFLRIENMDISAVAEVDHLSLELFPKFINISEASMALKLGIELVEPLEIIKSDGGQNGTGFRLDQLRFESYATLAALFPFRTTFSNISQRFQVSFADKNLFDQEKVAVTVDYDACRFLDVLQQLLGKLGAMSLSPQYVVGPTSMSSIGLENNLDSLFPSVGGFMVGALEGE
jgi:hypothetical protein